MQAVGSVLFLQGPLGPFFRELAGSFSRAGYCTHKINFNGGDRFFSGADQVVDYTGTPEEWPQYLQEYLLEHAIEAVFLLGDCRYYHRVAKPVCEHLKVAFMVFEEGYLRPDTITLESGGVNAFSNLDVSVETLLATPECSVKAPVSMGPTMKQRALYASLYYWAAFFARNHFSHYQHHRAFDPIHEGFCWLRGVARKQLVRRNDQKVHKLLTSQYSKRFVLAPLQVHDDSQKVFHSDYACVESFIGEVMRSFSANAGKDQVLCFKHHPMDRGYTHYGQFIERLTWRHNLQGRVFYCHDNSLPELYHHAASVVTVNSTVGLSALLHHLPVKAMGRVLYDIPGLTHQGPLDEFWQNPQPVDQDLFRRFHSRLFKHTQVNGSFFRDLSLSCHNALTFYQSLMHKRHIPSSCSHVDKENTFSRMPPANPPLKAA